MILPKIQGNLNISKNSFFIGSDSIYMELYTKFLALSLKKYAPWANIHLHIFNPTLEQIQWCIKNTITCTYEYVKLEKEPNTYYACVRFIRIPEIFKNDTRIITLDADGIAIKDIDEKIFMDFTNHSAVMWREKQKTSLASSVFFGNDSFRFLYSDRLTYYFKNDSFNWFLDQNILDQLIKLEHVKTTISNIWGNPKIGKNTLIWTAKGEKKFNLEFQKLQKQYNI